MTTYFMEIPILRDGKKITVEFGAKSGYGESWGASGYEPGDPTEFQIVSVFIDDDALPECKVVLTDDENETAYDYLAENYVYEPEDDYDEF